MDPSSSPPPKTVAVEDIRYFNHNGAYYIVAKVGEGTYIDVTMADLDVLISIRGIYHGRTFYYFSGEQLHVLAGIRQSHSMFIYYDPRLSEEVESSNDVQ